MDFLKVQNLSAVYDTSKGEVHALNDVDFTLQEGESLGIAGESACGKSTLGPFSYSNASRWKKLSLG